MTHLLSVVLTQKGFPVRKAIIGTPNPTCMKDSNDGLKFLVLNINLAVGNISFSVWNTGDVFNVFFMKIRSTSLLRSRLHCNRTALLNSLLYSATEINPQRKCLLIGMEYGV